MTFRSILFILIACIVLTATIAGMSIASLGLQQILEPIYVVVLLLILQIVGLVLLLKNQTQFQGISSNDAARQIAQQQKELDQSREQLQQELRAESNRLEQQSRKLTDRFCEIHEWLDSPELLDLQLNSNSEDASANYPAQSQQQDIAIKDIAEKDIQVTKILEVSAEEIYEKIRKNSYAPHGPFEARLLRDDLLDIAKQVANVYQPDLENPLAQTSPEQLARAINRIGLHLLAVMDQLPLDLKSYNIQQTYDTVRAAIKAYGAYKKASPYLNWATKGAYFGRVLASTNPFTIGLMWGATELGKIGAKKIAVNYFDRQAIGLMQDVVRVVGYEVASVYSDGFRYRDPNWCYGVELTHMMAAFPDSQDKLKHILQEVSRIQLRNEYDRLTLYRCVVAGKTINRSLTHPEFLEESQRRNIVGLLEKAHREVLHGVTSQPAESWRKAVQQHLGLQLSLNSTIAKDDQQADRIPHQILTCLAAFLSQLQQYPDVEIADRLTQITRSSLWTVMNLAVTNEDITQVASNISILEFKPPDIAPDSEYIDAMIDLLCDLYARQSPYSPEIEMVIIQFGLYYRRHQNEIYDRILLAFRSRATHQYTNADPVIKQATSAQCKAILYHQSNAYLTSGSFQSLFDLVTVNNGAYELSGEYFVLLTDHHLILFETGNLEADPQLIWVADESTVLQNTSGVLTASAMITAGKDLRSEQTPPISKITIQAPMTARYQQFFAPVIDILNGADENA
ncbi:MAG: hypothetical protein JKY95_17620 [Planctomycetaceae bacterium]|nr:hypothetical protein [Planctomycetaceae bacterium]